MRTVRRIALVVICGVELLYAGLLARTAAGAPVDLTLTHPLSSSPPASSLPSMPAQLNAASVIVLDNFNRPDGPIGPNWTVHDGFFNVVSDTSRGGGEGRATFNGAVGDTAEGDVAANGTTIQYTGFVLNYGAGMSNLFLKVQEQTGDGQFHHAACYMGNNGSPFGSFGLGFFALSSPFSTAHMKVTRSGNTVTIEFTNIDGGSQADQTYTCTGAPSAEGSGVGIVGFDGSASIDNFAAAFAPGLRVPVMSGAGLMLTVVVLVLCALHGIRRSERSQA